MPCALVSIYWSDCGEYGRSIWGSCAQRIHIRTCPTLGKDDDAANISGEVPYLTTEQMVEVDRAMMEDIKIELIQMMENAVGDLQA